VSITINTAIILISKNIARLKLTKKTKLILIILLVILGLFPLSILTLYLRGQEIETSFILLNQILYILSYAFLSQYVFKLFENSIIEKEKEVISEVTQEFFNTLSEERDVKDINVMEVPIRNKKGEVIAKGTIYSDLKINYYTVLNYKEKEEE